MAPVTSATEPRLKRAALMRIASHRRLRPQPRAAGEQLKKFWRLRAAPPLQLVGSLASRQGPAATTTLIDNEQQAQRGERLDSLKRVVMSAPRVQRARSTRRCSRRRWRCPSSRRIRSLRLPTQLRRRWRFSLLRRSAPPISSCRSRLLLRPSWWRSSSSRTSRRYGPTRRAAGHTSSRKRTWDPAEPCRSRWRCSSTTS